MFFRFVPGVGDLIGEVGVRDDLQLRRAAQGNRQIALLGSGGKMRFDADLKPY